MNVQAQKYERAASYKNYEIDLAKLYYHKIKRAVHRYSKDPNGKLLDIGCYDGTLASQFLPKRDVYGLEGHIKACELAVQKGVQAQSVDLEKGIPFKDQYFDTVIAAEIIEHLYDTDQFIKEIKRVLKDNGVLVMSIPNVACFTNRIKMLFGGYPRYAEYRAEGAAGHIRVYTGPVIKRQLIENGFDVIHFVGCNLPMPMHHPLIPEGLKKFAAWGGDFLPNIAGQVILAARKRLR